MPEETDLGLESGSWFKPIWNGELHATLNFAHFNIREIQCCPLPRKGLDDCASVDLQVTDSCFLPGRIDFNLIFFADGSACYRSGNNRTETVESEATIDG